MELRMAPEAIWQAVLGELQLSLQRPVFDSWLRGTQVVAYEDGCFVVAAKSAFAQEWLDQRMKGMIKRRLQRLAERTVDVRFIVRPKAVDSPPEEEQTPPLLLPQGEDHGRYQRPLVSTHHSLRPDMTFDTFIEGEGNRFAHAAAQAVAHNPGNHYNPLFLYGGVGLGKTHLLHAIGNAAVEQGYGVRYVSSETFTNDLIEAIRTKSSVAFRQTYREVDFLLIDDIQFIQGKDSTQNEIFHTFNSLYAANKQIVFASDRPPYLLTKLEDRLRSRFGGGLIADLHPPDLEHRIAILRAKAFEIGIVAPDEVIRYIADQYDSNVRELQGALTRIAAYSHYRLAPIDIALTKEVLGSIDVPLDDNPDAIMQAVADEYRITLSELTGKRRTKRIVVPRQMAMYLMRDLAQLSYPQIGELLGGRDHTTIIHGATKMEEELKLNAELKNRLEKIQTRLRR